MWGTAQGGQHVGEIFWCNLKKFSTFRQLLEDGYTDIAENLTQAVNLKVKKPSRDLAQILSVHVSGRLGCSLRA